jgi:hypothetical protein
LHRRKQFKKRHMLRSNYLHRLCEMTPISIGGQKWPS